MQTQKPKKTLSLDKNKLSNTKQSKIKYNIKNRLKTKTENDIQIFFKNTDKKLKDLYHERQTLEEQIQQIEKRLIFAKSEPLKSFLFELKSKDFDLLTKINLYVKNI